MMKIEDIVYKNIISEKNMKNGVTWLTEEKSKKQKKK